MGNTKVRSQQRYFVTVPGWLQRLFPNILWRVDTVEKKVFLTFDDGPHPEVTPWLLDLLSDQHWKATFFILGCNAEKHPELVSRMHEDGHTVGYHGYQHLDGWKTGFKKYIDNTDRGNNYKLFRPPFGRITWSQYRKLKQNRQITMWDLMPGDFSESGGTIENLKKHMQPGSIVVLHEEMHLKKLFPGIIKVLHERGFTSGRLIF